MLTSEPAILSYLLKDPRLDWVSHLGWKRMEISRKRVRFLILFSANVRRVFFLMLVDPGHVETAIHSAYFECRNGADANGSLSNGSTNKTVSVTSASKILTRAIETIDSLDSKAILSTHHAKILCNIGRDYDSARDVYRRSISLYPCSKYLVYSYFTFELSIRGISPPFLNI
jgi:hypothetical protein